MSGTILQRTQSGTPTDSKKATISVWIKLGNHVGNFNAGIFGAHVSGDYNANGNVQIGFYNGGLYAWFKDGGSTYYKQESTKRFRDHTAWYHLVYRYDTTQASGSDRIRIYVNGEEITSFASSSGPPQNTNIQMNAASRVIRVGTYNFLNGTANNFDGCMSHYHFCDGYSYAPTEFGSTDSTTGEWKINTSPNVQYGTNGFLILKDGNTISDQSSNSNDFSLGSGTLTKTEDNPSNIFCNLNRLATGNSAPTFSKGNNRVTANATNYQFSCGTIAVPLTGKWYWEVKANDNVNGSSTEYLIGAVLESRLEASGNFAEFAADGITQYGSVGTGIGQNDIIGVSVDRTAATLKIYKNNSLILTKSSLPAELIYPMVTVYGSVSADANFGNGYFGGTAVSSAGTNASNNGIFEYDVIPSDANALSTKGLNL